MNSMDDLRADLLTLKRKGHVSGPVGLFLANVLDRIEAIEQPRSAIRAGFFQQPEAGDFPNTNQPARRDECPVCVTRREWAIGAKT